MSTFETARDFFREVLPGPGQARTEAYEKKQSLARRALNGDEAAQLELAQLVAEEDRAEEVWS